MGQAIQVEPAVIGDVAIFDTDRGLTGQDGTGYTNADEAGADHSFPGRLAGRLFAADEQLDNVWVASNLVVLRREAEWDEAAVDGAAAVIRDFFLHYR